MVQEIAIKDPSYRVEAAVVGTTAKPARDKVLQALVVFIDCGFLSATAVIWLGSQ